MRKPVLASLLLSAFALTAHAQFSIQKVVVEEHTGAWCQYCPDGAVILDDILASQQNAIGISVHNGDAMAVADGDELGNFYISGYPMATINRNGDGLSRNVWASSTNTALQGASSCTVSFDSVSYNAATREITAYVKAYFTGPLSGDIRLNCAVTEDHVTGTGTGYNQVNYFNNVAGHPYYGAGNPIVGFDHRHVLRAYLGGAWGDAGIITSPVNFGSSFTHAYTYTLPAGYDENEIHLVAFVSKYDGALTTQRKIINGEEIPLIALTNRDEGLNANSNFMEIYPNPSQGRSTVAFTLAETQQIKVEVLNTLGQTVAVLGEGIMGAGAHTLYWNGTDAAGNEAANGVYMIRLAGEKGETLTQRMMLSR